MAFAVSLLTVRASASSVTPAYTQADAYLQRCGRVFAAERKAFRTEAALLAAVSAEREMGPASLWIADLQGKALTTEAFADHLRRLREGGTRHLLLGVGPASGWSADARAAAGLRLSLGAMTLPHELAALVLAEQIYRVSTIFEGHPYHLRH